MVTLIKNVLLVRNLMTLDINSINVCLPVVSFFEYRILIFYL